MCYYIDGYCIYHTATFKINMLFKSRLFMMLIAHYINSCTFNPSPVDGHWVVSSFFTISKLLE